MFWKWIPHQDFTAGKKPRTLQKGITPMGARFINLRTPQDTIQMIGDPGAPVPNVSIDLGVADIYISDQAQSIEYRGRGLETDVGGRVAGPAKGMSIPATEPVGHAYARETYPAQSVSRTAISKEAPPRKAVKEEPAMQGITQGISRVGITEAAREATEGELGVFEDETEEFAARFASPWEQRRRLVNRPKHSRRASRRKGRMDEPPTTMLGGIRL